MRERKARFSSTLLGTQFFHFARYSPKENFFPVAQSASLPFNKSSTTTGQILNCMGTSIDALPIVMILPASSPCKFRKKKKK